MSVICKRLGYGNKRRRTLSISTKKATLKGSRRGTRARQVSPSGSDPLSNPGQPDCLTALTLIPGHPMSSSKAYGAMEAMQNSGTLSAVAQVHGVRVVAPSALPALMFLYPAHDALSAQVPLAPGPRPVLQLLPTKP